MHHCTDHKEWDRQWLYLVMLAWLNLPKAFSHLKEIRTSYDLLLAFSETRQKDLHDVVNDLIALVKAP